MQQIVWKERRGSYDETRRVWLGKKLSRWQHCSKAQRRWWKYCDCCSQLDLQEHSHPIGDPKLGMRKLCPVLTLHLKSSCVIEKSYLEYEIAVSWICE